MKGCCRKIKNILTESYGSHVSQISVPSFWSLQIQGNLKFCAKLALHEQGSNATTSTEIEEKHYLQSQDKKKSKSSFPWCSAQQLQFATTLQRIVELISDLYRQLLFIS